MANKTSSGKGRTAAVRNRRVRQVRRVLNCVPSEKTERDWRFGNAVGAELLAARAAIPASKDLREGWWKISDQKDSGSCVGWATADSVVRWHLVKAGRLEKNQLLSPRFLWMASKETDEFDTRPTTFIEKAGTSLKAALDVARKFGTVLESVLPFATGKLSPQEPETFYALAAQRRIASYYNLGQDQSEWKRWLGLKGPILTRLSVDTTWDGATAADANLDVYHAPTARGGHAVALVGYRPDSFIVRNSWGKQWGDGGFAYASPNYARDAFTEAYGIAL